MYNAPPPHLMQGIQLVEAGRRADALPYLRHAVRTEAVTAEGWLWLAAASPDIDEYRTCVKEALRLDPHHPVALRMQNDLQRWNQSPNRVWTPPPFIPSPDAYATQRAEGDTTAFQRPSRLRRILRAVVLLVIVGGCAGGIVALIASGVIQDSVREWLEIEDTNTLDITVGQTPSYHFRVEVPGSWLPANTDSASWSATRDDLSTRFPAPSGQDIIWEQLDESFSQAERHPVYGEMSPPIHIVETDPDQLAASAMIAALTLTEISPFPTNPAAPPAENTPDSCTQMRALESAYQSGTLALPPGGETLAVDGTTLAARHDKNDCIFAIRRRYPVPTSFTPPTLPGQMPQAVHLIWIAVPVGMERYAVWTITFAESDTARYEQTVNRILETLQYDS